MLAAARVKSRAPRPLGRAQVGEPGAMGVAFAERAHSISPKFCACGLSARVNSASSKARPRKPVCEANKASAADVCGAAIEVPCRNE